MISGPARAGLSGVVRIHRGCMLYTGSRLCRPTAPMLSSFATSPPQGVLRMHLRRTAIGVAALTGLAAALSGGGTALAAGGSAAPAPARRLCQRAERSVRHRHGRAGGLRGGGGGGRQGHAHRQARRQARPRLQGAPAWPAWPSRAARVLGPRRRRRRLHRRRRGRVPAEPVLRTNLRTGKTTVIANLLAYELAHNPDGQVQCLWQSRRPGRAVEPVRHDVLPARPARR